MRKRADFIDKVSKLQLSGMRGASGFDAVVDYVLRPVKCRAGDKKEYFSFMREFGAYISSHASLNGVVPLDRRDMKFGGNMVNFSNAFALLGPSVDCIGTFGMPQPNSIFNTMAPNCRLHSIGDTSFCSALEFLDGKMMLADMSVSESVTWDTIVELIGKKELERIFCGAELVYLANWNEIYNSTSIWRNLVDDVLSSDIEGSLVCIDVTDFSSHSKQDICELMELLKHICTKNRVILTMNKHESQLLCTGLFPGEDGLDICSTGKRLKESFAASYLVIHDTAKSYAWWNEGAAEANTFCLDKLLLFTGSGDNFNAGFCAAVLGELDLESCLILANAVAGYYVSHGKSPTLEQVVTFLHEHEEEIDL